MGSYGITLKTNKGIVLIGGESDSLQFISKVTSYSIGLYGLMRYLVFTVTAPSRPICFLYMPEDNVGTCSIPEYGNSTDCFLGGGAWQWSNYDEINLGVVHTVYNTGGDTWEVIVRGAFGGYAKSAELYVFTELGSTVSSEAYGLRVFKSNGVDLSFDSGYTPVVSRWGASLTAHTPGVTSVAGMNFGSGSWSTREVDKPAFNSTSQDIMYCSWSLYTYNFLRFYRSTFTVIGTGLAKWYSRSGPYAYCSLSPYPADVNLGTSTAVGAPVTWYRHVNSAPLVTFIDGAMYD